MAVFSLMAVFALKAVSLKAVFALKAVSLKAVSLKAVSLKAVSLKAVYQDCSMSCVGCLFMTSMGYRYRPGDSGHPVWRQVGSLVLRAGDPQSQLSIR